VAIECWHVRDDGWSYGLSPPDTLWNWPVGQLIGTASFPDTGSFSLDVTDRVAEELAGGGNGVLSIKLIAGAGQSYPSTRIASPLAPIQRMRPRIVITYTPQGGQTALPDLAISTADLRFSPMRPAPGSAVTVQAVVRNLGPADAWNVPVDFWDGEPSVGQWIGTVVVPHVAGGGGEETAAAVWTAGRGLHEIYAVADASGGIAEADEQNNQDFRSFLVADPGDYIDRVESFEYPGAFLWTPDFDVPKQFTYFGPKSFYINRSGAEAYHGHYSTEMVLDGTADDGTIWLQTAIPVSPYAIVNVAVDFELFRYGADIAFFPVVAVTPLDPELESDFEILPVPAQAGWLLHSHATSLRTGPYDMLHIAVGLTVTWETPGTFFVDLIRTEVAEGPVGVAPGTGPGGFRALGQNRPNPMGPLTTIAYRLARDGPVTLTIHDAAGRFVATLHRGTQEAGPHRVHWDGRDVVGRSVPSGVYFYRLETSEGIESRKLLLAR
jgi:hypothetical protein